MTGTTGNGAGVTNGHSCEGPRPKRANFTVLQTVMDVLVFVVTSLVHIVQALVWAVAGKRQKSLEGGVALVTGGGGGLGRLLAMRLARLRCIVILWDINKDGELSNYYYLYTKILGASYVHSFTLWQLFHYHLLLNEPSGV